MGSRNVNSIFINLPIHDVAKTREFWTKLGFSFNEQFSDDKALCLILNEGKIYAMLISRGYYTTFTDRMIADDSTTQVLLAIQVESKEEVGEIMDTALANGGTRYLEPADEGFMYYDRFRDIDGHQWEIMCFDESQLPNG